MPLNKPLLLQVADAIEANPEHFDMDTYFYKNKCGTTACIAGWCWHLATKDSLDELFAQYSYVSVFPSYALQRLLGISGNIDAYWHLFGVQSWKNRKYRQTYLTAVKPQTKAKAAAEYVRWFCENYKETND